MDVIKSSKLYKTIKQIFFFTRNEGSKTVIINHILIELNQNILDFYITKRF